MRIVVDVEKRATIAVEARLTLCPHLVSYIDTNDRTPLTDGFIQMYGSLGRKNDDMTERVDVQVKGRTVRTKLPPASFRMERPELESVRKHGTVLLFVVHVAPDGSYVGDPRYAILAPVNVDIYLSEMKKGARGFAIPLRDLPEDPASIESIVAIASRTRNQRFFVGSGGDFLERIDSFRVHSATELRFDGPVVLSPWSGDFAVEAVTLEGVVVPVPGVLEILPASYTERTLDVTVRCGGVVYRDATIRQVDVEHHELRLSEALTLRLKVSGGRFETASVSVGLADNLAQRARDIEFFLALSAEKCFMLDESSFPFSFTDRGNHDELRQIKARVDSLIAFLDLLHIDASLIQLSEVTDDQLAQLDYLRKLWSSEDDTTTADQKMRTGSLHLELGRWWVALVALPNETSGDYVVLDPFNPTNREKFRLYRTDEGGEPTLADATIYETVPRDELHRILNLNLSVIADAYQSISDAPTAHWLANQTVLRLLHTADNCPDRREEFLGAAERLNAWLEEVEGATTPARLNQYQIKARRPGGLSPADKTAIRALRREILTSPSRWSTVHEAGCAILLEDADELDDCLSRLNTEQQEELEGYPIWALTGRAPTRATIPKGAETGPSGAEAAHSGSTG